MHILIVLNNSNAGAVAASHELAAYFGAHGITFSVGGSFELPRHPDKPIDDENDALGLFYPEPAGPQAVDLVVVLGGDGTVLRAARMVGTTGVPIVGINFGHLGFLSNPSDDGVVRVVEAALAGEVIREERSNLHIEAGVSSVDDQGKLAFRHVATFFALNELAITRGNLGRVVEMTLSVDGDRFMNVRGDGVVLASATGSTAYALSAGGPVVSPSHKGMVLVPLAPHSLRSRATVTAAGEVVDVYLSSDESTQSATLFVDGTLLSLDEPCNRFTLREGSRPTTLLRYQYDGFYSYAAKTFL